MIKAIIPAAFALACAASAQGACTQANIAGTWTAYSVGQDDRGQLAWVACRLVINPAGAFTSATSTCTAAGRTVQAQGSLKLSVPANCAYNGSISIVQAGSTDPIPSLTLSPDKQSATGVGGRNGSGNVFMFSMVKTK
jgi:hypothetical protein